MSRYLPEEVKSVVRAQANNQCGYCRSLQKYVLGILEIDHITPTAAGGSDDIDNLWLSCRLCNSFKGARTHAYDPLTEKRSLLFNPRKQNWYATLNGQPMEPIFWVEPCVVAPLLTRFNSITPSL